MSDTALLNERWRLGERLGSGGQGHTYLASDTQNDDREVVVKQLHLGAGSGTSWKKFDLFEREARVLQSLSHPGIPRFLDHFESEPGVFSLVMERAPGRPLSDDRHALTEADLRDVLRRCLNVLSYLHQLKPPVIHRDIKPANIIRDDDGTISLVDFGGVRAAVRERGGSTVVGTFGYMAPEQLHGQATAATDLYGLGATISALAGGVEPEDIPRKGLRMDLKKHLDTIDPALVKILAWMTEPDPDDRPQSAADVLERLGPDADKALAAIVPADSERALEPRDGDDEHYLIERSTFDFIDSMPRPVAKLLRIMLFIIGATGYLGMTVVRICFIPLLFGVVSAFSGDDAKASLKKSRHSVNAAVDETRANFRMITSLSSSRKRLPPKPDSGDTAAKPEAKAKPKRR